MNRCLPFLAGLMLCAAPAAAGEDDAIAHRLFQQGRHAEAAELFTDPAWKGVAFYRSEQHWRAVEAFLRAGDADSTYNLGNAYARLGYFELALQAYLAALAVRPDDPDATGNADLMRRLIAERENAGSQGLAPKADAIDRLDDGKEAEDGSSGDGERGAAQERERGGMQENAEASESAARESGSEGDGDGGEENRAEAPQGDPADRRAEGRGTDEPADDEAAGLSEGGAAQEGTAASERARIEMEQATEQWLNRIVDEPARFLKARIDLEARRRAAGGTLPRTEDDAW